MNRCSMFAHCFKRDEWQVHAATEPEAKLLDTVHTVHVLRQIVYTNTGRLD